MSVDLNLNIKNTVSIETSTGISEKVTVDFALAPNTQISNTLNANFTLKWAQTLCSQSNYREPRRKKGKSYEVMCPGYTN